MDLLEYIFYFIIMGAYIGLLAWKLPTIEQRLKHYYQGVIIFYILWNLGQFLWLLMEFVPEGIIYNIYYGLGNFFSYMGATIFLFVVERYVYNKLKYIPTTILAITTIIDVLVIEYYGTFLQIIPTFLSATITLILPIIYFKVAIETEGKTRIKGMIMGSSLLIFLFGIISNTYFFYALLPEMEYIAPIIQLVGAGIYNYAFLFYRTSYE